MPDKKVYMHRLAAKTQHILEHIESEDRKGWVKWGKDNDYPQWLLQLYYHNAIHGGIINSKVMYLTSGGFTIESDDDKERIKGEMFLKNVESDYDFSDIFSDNAFDVEMFRAFAIRGVWAKDGSGISMIESIDVDKIRINLDKDVYYYSDDWSKSSQSLEKTGYRIYLPYDEESRKGDFILYAAYPSRSENHKEDLGVYPKPGYSGGIVSIHTDTEIDHFNGSEIVNSFKAGTLISLNSGVPTTEEDRERITDELVEGGASRDNAGGMFVTFARDKNHETTVQNLNGNDLPQRYLQLETSTQQKILTAHSVTTPGLFGIKTAGQLGSVQELEAGYAIFKKTYISGVHEFMTSYYNYLLKIAGINATIILNEPEPLFAIDGVSDEATKVLTALNSMPVIAQQKIMDNMSQTQILSLIGLTAEPGSPDPKSEQLKASDPVYAMLTTCGRYKGGVVRVAQNELPHEITTQLLDETESKLKRDNFVSGLTDFENRILAQIIDGVKIKDLQGEGGIREALNALREKGYLNGSNKATEIARELVAADNFDILYEYALRSDAPALVEGGSSRPFCSQLIGLNRLYTREEIDRIGASVGRDVWRYRGGWYHNPDTERNTPACRHTWRQVLVQK